MPVPELIFLAPPSSGPDDEATASPSRPAAPRPRSSGRRPEDRPAEHGRRPGGKLRMTRGARRAASGMDVADADIQRCLEAPEDVAPDPRKPSRSRYRRGDLSVVAGADGMVLRIDRRGR